ncbi:ankyrin repeat-containing domain protein, partial [Sphaerosporella brunnea]
RDKDGRSAFAWAVYMGHHTVVEHMLCSTAIDLPSLDVNQIDTALRTPLHTAVIKDYPDVVELLLSAADVDVNAVDYAGNTPLAEALSLGCAYGMMEDVKKLLEKEDVQADIQDHNGLTPLIFATEQGHTESSRLLLENRASKDVGKVLGRTPSQMIELEFDVNEFRQALDGMLAERGMHMSLHVEITYVILQPLKI